MNRILLFVICIQLFATNLFSQEFNRQDADSMMLALKKTKTGADRLELLLNLAQFHIFKPNENKLDLDSAAVLIDEAKELNKKIHMPATNGYLLFTEACLVKERGPKITVPPYFTSEESWKMVEKAITMLESGTNKNYLGRAYFELATRYDSYDSLQGAKKMELAKKSAEAFTEAGNLKRKGRSLELVGDIYYIWGQHDKSVQTLEEALTIYKSIHYPRLQGLYLLMGRAFLFKHDQPAALFYLLRAHKIAQSLQDSSGQLSVIDNYLGTLYYDIDLFDLGNKYLNEALSIAIKSNNERNIVTIVTNLADGYNEAGQPAQALNILQYIPKRYLSTENVMYKLVISWEYLRTYTEMLQLDKARPYCDTVINITDKLNHNDYYSFVDNRKAMIYLRVARFYFFSHDYAKSRYYLEKSNVFAKKINYDRVTVNNLELLYKLDSAEGNSKAAFAHLLQYKQKADSAFSKTKIRQFEMMNVGFEMEMKDDSIKLKDKDIALLTQKNNHQKENLKQASFIRNITIAGIIMAFIVIGLLYWLYRNKQKSNTLITQKNEQLSHLLTEKEWLVKEIHHRVKNNLQMVVSLLNAQTEFVTHPSALDAIKESRERMQAIAIIHQKLYQLDNSNQINMRSYIHDLIDNIRSGFADNERIQFKTDVVDVSLDVSQSVPLGLILNEAITNSIKYAYPKNEKGSIQISLKHFDNDKLQLKIADNGKGLPPDVDVEHSNSLGMQLIRLFSEQLEADLYFINNNGLEITLNFNATAYHDAAAVNKIIA